MSVHIVPRPEDMTGRCPTCYADIEKLAEALKRGAINLCEDPAHGMKRVLVVGRITAPRKAAEPPWSAGSRQILARADLGYRDAMNFGVNIHPGEPPEMMVVALRETFRSIDRHRLT